MVLISLPGISKNGFAVGKLRKKTAEIDALAILVQNTASWQNQDGLERPSLVRASARLEMTHPLLSGKTNYDQARLKSSLDLEATGDETNQWWSPDSFNP